MASINLASSSVVYWHVRISPKRKSVLDDYEKFLETMMETGQGLWDRDSKNQIKTGDYLGFITGENGKEQIHIYKVSRVCTTIERLPQWASDMPYTTGNGFNSVSDRQAIVLTNDHSLPKTYDWHNFRRATGLGNDCSTWMPRGTQKVSNKETLPFDIDAPKSNHADAATMTEDYDEDAEEINVIKFKFEGKDYLRCEDDDVYDYETHEQIGIWNKDTKEVMYDDEVILLKPTPLWKQENPKRQGQNLGQGTNTQKR